VVASEVGNLAQRSAAAAKEVKSLIQDSLERIQLGHKLVDESGQALTDIILAVKKVTDIVGEIASASREQSIGVDQVNQAVSQMDQVTQSNAAQTDQLSHTAQGLAANAEQLRKLLMRFQLSGQQHTGQYVPPARAGRSRETGRGTSTKGRAHAATAKYNFEASGHVPANDASAAPSDFEVLSAGGGRDA
jgi:ABC-type transporter Mla subunit MlaD